MTEAEFNAKTREALVALAAYFGLSKVPNPVIKWDLRGRSCIGQAVGVRTIRLHREAAMVQGDAYLHTCVHEACHIAVVATIIERRLMTKSGRWSSHGLEWQRAMKHLGFEPRRVSTMDPNLLTPARTTKRYTATCDCPGKVHVVGPVQAKRIVTGAQKYQCRLCRGVVVLEGVGSESR